MTKADFAVLEKVFGCEITGVKFQSKSKRVKRLAQEGYLQLLKCSQVTSVGRFTWEKYGLTHKGTLAFLSVYKKEAV